jgi:hypothetical protein
MTKDKRIDGEWMRGLERGELNEDAAKMLLHKEWMGLGLYAWENRSALTHDLGLFVVECEGEDINTLDIAALERKYRAKHISGTYKDGKMYAMMKEWHDISIEVSVWNMEAQVIYRNDAGEVLLYTCSEDVQRRLNSMALQSVEDAGGAINMSGIYPPNHDLIELFRESLNSDVITLEGGVK